MGSESGILHARPTKSKSQRRVAESHSVTSKTRGKRQPRGHLSESTHNQVHDETHESVGDQD
jgi:hypothetical protein